MQGKILLARNIIKSFYTITRSHQVTVLGAAGDIGQTICLLLRSQPDITKLVIHDTQAQMLGVILDLSHVPANATVKGYVGESSIEQALLGSEIIIGAGGSTFKPPGSNENLRLTNNIDFIKSLCKGVCRLKPMPFVGIITNPLNSLIPMAAEIMRDYGEYNPKRLFGITNIDSLRAQILFAADYNLDPSTVSVPVIGGNSPKTCIPLLSQAQPLIDINELIAESFTSRMRKLDDSIIVAKRGLPPVLSIAYSALLFTRSILAALDGHQSSVHALIDNNDFGTEYFSGEVDIDENGVKQMKTYTKLSKYECLLLENSIVELRKDILKGKKTLLSVR